MAVLKIFAAKIYIKKAFLADFSASAGLPLYSFTQAPAAAAGLFDLPQT
ncbi:MAG: hypothetical protein IPL27_06040 [Lewinellaceae bacterium]|nr:hypothetical protein [Lewinellaceae bacterium]